MEKNKFFWNCLFTWYENNKRDFPWRNTKNPFHILIAEILLQQTNVRKVTEVYNELASKYPTSCELADANIKDIKNIIKPLGLLYRAERLINASKNICFNFNGNVPADSESLLQLPGVGPYISEAVLCYAFDKNTVPVDTNVIRLFCRFFDLKSNYKRPRTDKKLKNKITKLYDFTNIRKSNLAVLDFASEVCKANNPECKICPLSYKCSKF